MLPVPKQDEPGAYRYMEMTLTAPILQRLFSAQEPRPFNEGKIAILVNEATQSSGEFLAMRFRVCRNVKVFGSTTAGADGNVVEFAMPGGLKTRISGFGVYTPNRKETQRVGIIPDVRVQPMLDDIRQGKDRIMETATKWIKAEE